MRASLQRTGSDQIQRVNSIRRSSDPIAKKEDSSQGMDDRRALRKRITIGSVRKKVPVDTPRHECEWPLNDERSKSLDPQL